MKKCFLGIICLLYTLIIIYVFLTGSINNYLSPNIQFYLKISIVPLTIMGLIFIFNENIKYNFKASDISLLLPLLMLFLAKDGRLTLTFANNRMSNFNIENNLEKDDIININNSDNNNFNEDIEAEYINDDEGIEYNQVYDFSDTYFDVVDASYSGLANYLTYMPKAIKYKGEKIRVRGFSITDSKSTNKGYFLIGKYEISCCAADAEFVGFFAKYDISKIKNNTWYEIEGVLEEGRDSTGYDILYIKVININEIDENSENQYIYPCYTYDSGECSDIAKYKLEY